MRPEAICDPRSVDFNNIVVDKEGLRKLLPQRFEMEQLDAIVHFDPSVPLWVGYRDVRPDEFWVRGHMPDYPLMPGVLICEAAAQLCGYLIAASGQMEGDFLGFGGMENVRFRGPVRPGDRLILMARPVKMNRRQMVSHAQAFVGDAMVFHGDIIGVPLNRPKQES